ncbi:hypothetical protein BU16DRAFT_529120 [Lophium mytilinum]|uniref:Uncharacterized protein n=1 Tax=Lophium mytilinum TaxID=390894 RepID=A0A6A6QKT3_9PEZI|nr:hypothetical protein BU16DRAFT_529120 [Lophium mytilinum]
MTHQYTLEMRPKSNRGKRDFDSISEPHELQLKPTLHNPAEEANRSQVTTYTDAMKTKLDTDPEKRAVIRRKLVHPYKSPRLFELEREAIQVNMEGLKKRAELRIEIADIKLNYIEEMRILRGDPYYLLDAEKENIRKRAKEHVEIIEVESAGKLGLIDSHMEEEKQRMRLGDE